MALTTTTGLLPWLTRPFTMSAVRLMAAGSSTEVPPNFITTRFICKLPNGSAETASRMRDVSSHGLQLAQARQQLGVENSRAGGAANRIVREHCELPVEHAARAQPAYGHSHAVAAVAVEARLRPVRLSSPLDRLIGRRRQALPGQRTELCPRRQQFFLRRLPLELER